MSEKNLFLRLWYVFFADKILFEGRFFPSMLNMSSSSDLQNFWQVGKKNYILIPLYLICPLFLLRLRIFLIPLFLAFLIWYVLFCDYWGVYSVYISYNFLNVCIYNFIIFKTSVTIVPWTFFPVPVCFRYIKCLYI